jgi:hypothetical protein
MVRGITEEALVDTMTDLMGAVGMEEVVEAMRFPTGPRSLSLAGGVFSHCLIRKVNSLRSLNLSSC